MPGKIEKKDWRKIRTQCLRATQLRHRIYVIDREIKGLFNLAFLMKINLQENFTICFQEFSELLEDNWKSSQSSRWYSKKVHNWKKIRAKIFSKSRRTLCGKKVNIFTIKTRKLIQDLAVVGSNPDVYSPNLVHGENTTLKN